MKTLFSIIISVILFSSYSSAQIDMTTVDDVCEDDAPFTIAPITPFNPSSGYAGIAIFMITPDDVTASGVDFSLQDFDGNYFFSPVD